MTSHLNVWFLSVFLSQVKMEGTVVIMLCCSEGEPDMDYENNYKCTIFAPNEKKQNNQPCCNRIAWYQFLPGEDQSHCSFKVPTAAKLPSAIDCFSLVLYWIVFLAIKVAACCLSVLSLNSFITCCNFLHCCSKQRELPVALSHCFSGESTQGISAKRKISPRPDLAFLIWRNSPWRPLAGTEFMSVPRSITGPKVNTEDFSKLRRQQRTGVSWFGCSALFLFFSK